jgi:hypothetical protein
MAPRDSQYGRRVLEDHDECRRILGFPEGFPPAQISFGCAEGSQADPPRCAFEHQRDGEHAIDDGRMLDRSGTEQSPDPLIGRDSRAQGEDQQRHDEAPEIQFPSVAEGVQAIRRASGACDSVQQEKFVDRID